MLGVIAARGDGSYIGGAPGWLGDEPQVVPRCGACEGPLKFVAQVLAPVRDLERALHIYVCEAHAASDNGWRVLRTQRPKPPPKAAAAAWASADAWEDDEEDEDDDATVEERSAPVASSGFGFRRSEIAWVADETRDGDSESEPETDEAMVSRARAYLAADEELAASSRRVLVDAIERRRPAVILDASDEAYERPPDAVSASVALATRVGRCPRQVFRYAYGERPLAVDPSRTPIPACSCGTPRRFEVEVLPTLIYALGSSRMEDFASLAIYSCDLSCDRSEEEIGRVQVIN